MSVVGSVTVRVVPSFDGMHQSIRQSFYGARGAAQGAAGDVGAAAGSAMASRVSESILGKGFTNSFRTSFGRAKAIAEGEGGVAGRSWVSRTASTIEGGAESVAGAITQPFTGAMADVTSVGNATGLNFVNASSSAVGDGASALQDAVTSPFSGVMGEITSVGNATGLNFAGAASSSIAQGGLEAGQSFMSNIGDSMGAGMGTLMAGAEKHAIDVGNVFGGGFVSQFTKKIGPLAGVLALGSVLGGGFSRLADIDDAEAKFRGLGYSAEDIETQMDSALASVEGTTIGLDQAATAAVGAAGAGVDMGEDMTDWLAAIGDATAMSSAEYDHMAQIMNKVQGEGRVMGGDLTQMAQNGFEAASILAEHMGIGVDEVRALASEGEISADLFQEAIEGQIGGAAKEMSQTLRGSISEAIFQFKILGAEFLSSSGLADLFRDAMLGLGSFLENTVTPAISNLFDWFDRWGHIIRPIAAVIGGIVAGFVAFKVAATAIAFVPVLTAAIAGGLRGIGAAIAGIPIIGWIAMAIGALVAFFKYTETGQKLWASIVDWFTGTAMPALSAAWEWVSGVFSWVWENVLKPVWDALVSVVTWVWQSIIQPVFRFIVAAFQALGTAFAWVWNSVIKPMWDGFMATISFLWNSVLRPIFGFIAAYFRTMANIMQGIWHYVLGPLFDLFMGIIRLLWNTVARPIFRRISDAFQTMGKVIKAGYDLVIKPAIDAFGDVIDWLWDKVIQPTLGWIGDRWDWLAGIFSSVWNDNIKPILTAFGDFFTETIPGWVDKGVEKIGGIWETVKGFFARPINWVIDTVWNNGIRSAFNTVSKLIPGVSEMDKVPLIGEGGSGSGRGNIPGYAKGGVMGDGWKLVGEEGPELIRTGPGWVATASETKNLLGGSGLGIGGGDEDENQLISSARRAGRVIAGGARWAGGAVADGARWVGDQASKALDWVRGSLGRTAETLIQLATAEIRDKLGGQKGMGQMGLDLIDWGRDKVVEFISGKDDEYNAAGIEGGEFTANPGGFNRPAAGTISSRAGQRAYSGRFGNMHYGVDIANGIGTTIRAAYDGVVRRIYGSGMDQRMVLGHKGFDTSYLHNSAHLVGVGETVTGGQPIARMGTAGTGPHLHFEVHPGGWYNPSVDGVNALFRDKGGLIYPGMNQVLNETGSAEYVFNQKQFDNLNRLAQSSSGEGWHIEQHNHVSGSQYRDAQDLRMTMRREAKRQKAGAF